MFSLFIDVIIFFDVIICFGCYTFINVMSINVTILFQMLHAIKMFGANLDEYLHLLLPPVVKLFDSANVPINVRK